MMSIIRGLAYILSKGTGINEGIPAAYTITGRNLISVRTGTSTANLTWAVVLMAVVFAARHFILKDRDEDLTKENVGEYLPR